MRQEESRHMAGFFSFENMFIDFEKIDNFRDLGGLITSDGKIVKSGLLFRSGELNKATERDVIKLRDELCLSQIIDFRDLSESKERPDQLWDTVKYNRLPALPPMGFPSEHNKKPEPKPEDAVLIFPQIYRELASTSEALEAYRNFFAILLNSDSKPILWHCKQGKDRTGVAAILLYVSLGVPKEQWLPEYLLTNQYMQGLYNRYLQQEREAWKKELMHTLLFVREDWLNEYLKIIENQGGLDAFIRHQIGLTECEIQKLRTLYLQ